MDKDVSSVMKEAVAEVLEQVRRVPSPGPVSTSSGNRIELHINAGGIGVWIAATACLVMAGMLAVAVPVGVGAYLALKTDVEALDDSDNAIRAYINTGILKPRKQPEPEK